MLSAATHLTDRFLNKAKGVSNPGSSACMHAASVLSEPRVNFSNELLLMVNNSPVYSVKSNKQTKTTKGI